MAHQHPGLLDQRRNALRTRHYSRRTEEAYMAWVRRFAAFHDLRDPRTLTSADVSRFLTALAAHGVAASTQNQALSAVLFLYQMVLHLPVPELHDIVRARRPERLPVVLSRSEVSQVLARLTGMEWLMASMLYGCGLRLLACVQLRVKDVLLERGEVVVRHGKGGKDRVTMLPVALRAPLQRHLRERRATHEADLAAGRGTVALPDGLQRKFPSNDRSDSRQRGVPTRPWSPQRIAMNEFVLDPDVARVFGSSATVNRLLRSVIKAVLGTVDGDRKRNAG